LRIAETPPTEPYLREFRIQESEFPLTLGAALNLEGPILKTAFLSGLSA
jgi:hypothetical protein